MLNKILDYSFYDNKSILITGGTGSLGNELTDFFLNKTNLNNLYIFSRDEFKQSVMKKKYRNHINKSKLHFIIGNIRDIERLKITLKNINIVIHAASLKQVDSIEFNPSEAIKTNIIGIQNVIDACIFNEVSILVGISTDKSVAPVNLYGGTKLCLEKLVILSNKYNQSNLKTCVIRYGNVVGSRGSVIPLFLSQNKSGIFTVTSEKMTRFTLTLEQACNFVINSITIMKGSEIFIPKLKKYTLPKLCSIINNKNKIKIIGLRPGEKIHEEMICEAESYKSWESNNFFIIKNELHEDTIKKFNFKKRLDIFSYNSNNAELISDNELINQIETIKNYLI